MLSPPGPIYSADPNARIPIKIGYNNTNPTVYPASFPNDNDILCSNNTLNTKEDRLGDFEYEGPVYIEIGEKLADRIRQRQNGKDIEGGR